MAVIVKIRRGTTAQWASSTKVLQVGELGIDTTLNKIKAGNGSSLWPALPWLIVSPDEFTTQASNTLQDANDYTDTAVASLGNSLDGQYVEVGDVGVADGVASLGPDGKIPDTEIPDGIARDTEIITSYNDLTDLPSLFDGNYNSLLNLPTLFSGSYNDLTDKPTVPDLTGYATETYVDTVVSNLVDTAPETLNTLNELAAAINDDASFASTVTTALGNKLDSSTASSTYLTQTDASTTYAPINSPTFTGTVGGITKSMIDLANVDNTSDANKPVSTATQTALDLKLDLSSPSVDYYITNSGSGAYIVNGVSNGLITFEKGKKYRIHINASGHPFWIQTVSGAYSAGNVYSTGITNGGAQVGYILVELPQNAPDDLYYVCQYHSSMQGSISVQSQNTITINSKSSSYTILPVDSGKLIEMSAGGTLTITDSASFPVGYSIDVLQTGSSQVTIAGDGFTPNATPGLKLRTQWSSATLIKRALNSWVVLGDLSA